MVNEVEIDRSDSKIAVLAVLGVISFFLFGYFLKSYFWGGDLNFFWFSLGSLSVYLIIFLFQSLLIKSVKKTNLIIFFESAALLAGFYDRFNRQILAAAFIVFLFLLWGNYNGVRQLRDSVKVKFWRVSKATMPKAIAAAALFGSVVYMNVGAGDFFLSRAAFEEILNPSVLIVQKFVPNFNFSFSVNELAANLAEKQISETPQARLLPKSVKAQLAAQSAKELENQFSSFLGASIDPKLKISEVIYETLKNKFLNLPENIKNLVLLAAGLIIFLTIESFAMPFRLIISFIGFIIYEILLAVGFATIVLEGKNREIIILK
ncbi:hypothetical protein HZB06_00390 [Candidatus Wolfebacteria bacterium]|nr:hypothetical protein [Candidatus Wolfebacteria bacterium]